MSPSTSDVTVPPLCAADRAAFVAAARRSRDLHRPWVTAATDEAGFDADLARVDADDRRLAFLVREGEELVGRVNLNEITRGALMSAYTGYYAFTPLAGRGLFRQGMSQVIDLAFGTLGLHRLEANVQPDNVRSLRLAESLGFQREGFSPRYLFIDGEWRDHVRTALLAEDWPGSGALTEG